MQKKVKLDSHLRGFEDAWGQQIGGERCPPSNYQCQCHAKQTGICQSAVLVWRLSTVRHFVSIRCTSVFLRLARSLSKQTWKTVNTDMCVFVKDALCVFENTEGPCAHWTSFGVPIIYFPVVNLNPVADKINYGFMYVHCRFITGCECVSVCLCVCVRLIFMRSCAWERVTVTNYYLESDITKQPAILSSVCVGDIVSIHAGVYF